MSLSALLIGGVCLLLGGGVGGYMLAVKPHAALERPPQQLLALQEGQAQLVAERSKPLQIDAELRATLAETPPACVQVLGGDPLSAQCLLQACWQYGQSAAQRPDCDAVETLAVETRTPEAPIEL